MFIFSKKNAPSRQNLQEDNPNILKPVSSNAETGINTLNQVHNNAVFPPAWPQRVMTPIGKAGHSDVRYDGTLRKWGNR